jgi:hypothetical protein
MVMDEVFGKLRTLQDILKQKIELEHEIEDIPKILTTQEDVLSRLKKSFIEKNQEYDRVKANVAQFKTLLAEAESNRERAERNMDTITTQREYEALDKEIKDATEKEQQYRKDLQREEKNLSVLAEELQSDASMIEATEKELAERRAGIEAEIAEKRAQIDALKQEEQNLTPGLDPEVYFKFERIIRNKMGLGIVPIKGGVCNGCHMILPAQFANQVRMGEEIIFCPYCSRILYYEESEQSEQDFFNDEDSGSLSDLDDLDMDDEEEEEEEEEEDDKVDMEYDE